jgi:DNA-binding NtrC family response regulator
MVDDDPIVLEVNITALNSEGIRNITVLDDSRKILSFLENTPVSIIILDLNMPHTSGIDLLPILSREYPHIPIIVMTSSDDLETAVNCMKAGAVDYLTKPMNVERLLLGIEKAFKVCELSIENHGLREHLLNDTLEHPEAFSAIVTNSKKMRAIFQYIEVIAKSDQPVLITGETGTGKELIARAIATLSDRKGSFVTVNAAGLDDNMFSDTLFGHKKGAFTGADSQRDGLISAAAAGTIFLDEIGDLNERSQVKLLRLIQEGEYYPTGSDILKSSDARIIVATNRNLPELISAGTFRKDLYYRLCGHRVHIPPLGERREDIPILLEHLVTTAAQTLNKTKPALSREVIAMLSTYHFQGNIRELHGMVFDAVARHSSGMLQLDCFAGLNRESVRHTTTVSQQPSSELDKLLYTMFGRFPTIHEVEEYLIASAMSLTDGNQSSAASLLGIARQTLSKRLNGPTSNPTNTVRKEKDGMGQYSLFQHADEQPELYQRQKNYSHKSFAIQSG